MSQGNKFWLAYYAWSQVILSKISPDGPKSSLQKYQYLGVTDTIVAGKTFSLAYTPLLAPKMEAAEC